MTVPRVLMIGLDGFELSLADEMIRQGELPALRAVRDRSARFLLNHGRGQRTGRAWEHVATGQVSEGGGRPSSVYFDRHSYQIGKKRHTKFTPFTAGHPFKAVVLDAPYFDMELDPATRGIVNWGSHDPGVARRSNPRGIDEEIAARFGAYPAESCMYAFVWPSANNTRQAGELIARSAEMRGDVATWLLKERLPDWDLGIVVGGEAHSGVEAMWHGIDPDHPLHDLPSAQPAREALRAIYRAIDGEVDKLVRATPDASHVVFAMHGMGTNDADPPSMVLLPELLYRRAFNESYLRPGRWRVNGHGVPLLAEDETWDEVMKELVPMPKAAAAPRSWTRSLRSLFSAQVPRADDGEIESSLEWMAAARYQPFWSRMPAFALPSFYDGRIRFNLAGREANGMIALESYQAAFTEMETLLRECRNSLTGGDAVATIRRADARDPRDLDPFTADLVVEWTPKLLGLVHPKHGQIGPVPYRRVGGHTGRHGFAYVAGRGIRAGDFGVHSSFQVVPTVLQMLGAKLPAGGRSLLAEPLAA